MPFLRFHPKNGTFLELSASDFQTAIQKPKRRPTALHPNRQTNRAQDVLVITGDYTPFDIRVHITQRTAPGVENFPRTDRHGDDVSGKILPPASSPPFPRASGSMRQDHERHVRACPVLDTPTRDGLAVKWPNFRPLPFGGTKCAAASPPN